MRAASLYSLCLSIEVEWRWLRSFACFALHNCVDAEQNWSDPSIEQILLNARTESERATCGTQRFSILADLCRPTCHIPPANCYPIVLRHARSLRCHISPDFIAHSQRCLFTQIHTRCMCCCCCCHCYERMDFTRRRLFRTPRARRARHQNSQSIPFLQCSAFVRCLCILGV